MRFGWLTCLEAGSEQRVPRRRGDAGVVDPGQVLVGAAPGHDAPGCLVLAVRRVLRVPAYPAAHRVHPGARRHAPRPVHVRHRRRVERVHLCRTRASH